MKKAIYAFSGDPVTFGHVDITERASKIFDEVIVAIGTNPLKNCIFTTDEREAMARKAFSHLSNVTVTSFRGLLADFAYENDVSVIIRGLRNSEDFNFELMLHQLSESQVNGIETFLLPCKQDLAHVSSSAAKALQLEQGLVHEYVPLSVKQKLEERISGQLLIGVTGEPGSGKSYFCDKMKTLCEAEKMKVHLVKMDKLAHDILERSTDALYIQLRKKLIELFGKEIQTDNGFIDSAKLGTIIFSDRDKLDAFNQLIHAPLLLKLRREIYGKRGLILIESALFAELQSLYLCNNYLVVTNCSRQTQRERLLLRGYTEEKICRRLECQFPFKKKVDYIRQHIAADRFGKVFLVENATEDIPNVFEIVNKLMPALVF